MLRDIGGFAQQLKIVPGCKRLHPGENKLTDAEQHFNRQLIEAFVA